MRRCDPIRFGDAWNEFLRSCPSVARKIAEAKAVRLWEEVMGGYVASQTRNIELKNGVLTAYITSSAVRHELFMRRASIQEAMNQAVGMKVVNVVIIK